MGAARPALAAIVVAASLLFGAAEARADKKVRRAGDVTYWSEGRVYLDRGAADGLEPGAEVRLFHRRRRVGVCVVEHVAASQATCKGKLTRRATRYSVPVVVRRQEPLPEPPPLLDAKDLEQGQQAIASARFDKVAFEGGAREALGYRFPIDVGLRHESYVYGGFERGFHQERVQVGLRGAGLGVEGLTAWVRADVVGVLGKPPEPRFRPDDIVRLDVFETAVSYRPDKGAFGVTVGRFLPWNVVGLTVLDGAAGGLRLFDDAVEVGAYGGLLPDAVTLYPRFDRFAVGGYYALRVVGEHLYVRHLGRVGGALSLDLGMRAEAEASVDVAWDRWLSVGAGARAGVGSDGTMAVDTAHAHLQLRPLESISLSGGYRFRSPTAIGIDDPKLFFVGPAFHHADASVRYMPVEWLALSVTGGGAFDLATHGRLYAGPDVAFPRLFGDLGGLSVGYQEELGTLRGRAMWTALQLYPLERTYLSTRLSAFEDAHLGDASRELSWLTFGDAQLLSWLWLRGSTRMSVALPALNGLARATPWGVTIDASVVGTL